MRLHRLVVVALLASLAVPVGAQPAEALTPALTDDVALEVVVSGLSLAVDLAAPPGDDRLFIVEKAGRVRIFQNGSLLPTPFLDISGPVLSSANEQGLLGIAFPADYAESGHFYVYYTSDAGSGDTVVAEYSVGPNRNVADPASGRVLFTLNQPYSNHNGGSIHFGPDGYLYIALGDGGGGGDPGENGQNNATLLGTIIRVDPATGDAAPGNPFIDKAGADEIWLWGLRNPWRFSFDAATGDMYIGDVGQGAVEEVDIVAAGVSGSNFGWDAYEGSTCYEGPCDTGGLTFPIHEYSHRSGPVCGGSGGAITGGYVYRGNELPWLRGHYFFADWCLGDLRSFRWNGTRAVEHTNWNLTLSVPLYITSFGVDGFGELYFLAQGKVYKFVSTKNPDCDFNSDGLEEAAVGSPGEGILGAAAAGRVVVFEGRDGPIDPSKNSVLRQGVGGVAGVAEPGDRFGSTLACGDFDGDGFADLAVGVPGEAGLHVVYGSATGLSGPGSQYWTQSGLGLGAGSPADEFASALAAGDINRDGFADLVIGLPGDVVGGAAEAGSVAVVLGSAAGLSSTGARLINQETAGVRNRASPGDSFGRSVALGDLNGNGFFDVIVGVPGERIGGMDSAGAVAVLFGTKAGVGRRDLLVHRNTPGIKGKPRTDDRFGTTVASGGFDGDGFDDLAVGILRAYEAGLVQVVYGAYGGPGRRNRVLREGRAGIAGIYQAGDRFGAALAAGDANGDGFDDLAVGAPGDSPNGVDNAGLVGLVPGGFAGLRSARYQEWHQDVANVKGVAAVDDQFGTAVKFIDTRGDGRLDLVIGAPQVPGGAGEVSWLPGRAGGISAVGDRLIRQDTPGVPGNSEPGDAFGGAL